MDSVNDADLVARPLYQAHYVVCASPTYLASQGTPSHPNELDPKACLGIFIRGSYKASDWTLTKDDSTITVSPQGKLCFNSSDSLVIAAEDGQGVIHILDIFAKDQLESGRLVPLFLDWQTSVKTFFAVTPASRYVAPKTRALIDFLMSKLDRSRHPPVDTMVQKV